MEASTGRIAWRVLLVHALLLLAIAGVVFLAARGIYAQARAQAIEQARIGQELLASQTAGGVEQFFQSLVTDLSLLEQTDYGEALSAERVWERMRDRAGFLVVLNAADLRPLQSFSLPVSDSALRSAEIRRWLGGLSQTGVSGFERAASGDAVLVARPLSGGRVAVASVALARLAELFLGRINELPTVSATLLDSSGQILVTSDPSVAGQYLPAHLRDARQTPGRTDVLRSEDGGTELLDRPVDLGGGIILSPRLVTIRAIHVPGRTWRVVLGGELVGINSVVKRLFDRTLLWSIGLVLAVTAVLASTSVQMIRGRLRLERARHDLINRELRQARQIQLKWLPPEDARIKHVITVAAINRPASHISGDFYNWFELPDGRIAVLIGDVTGHGMSAAFLMATTQLLLRTTLPRIVHPGKCLEAVNEQLCSQAFHGQFVTLLVCILDLDGRTLEVATAGHMPPILVRDGSAAPLAVEPQLMLGIEAGLTFPSQTFPLPESAGLVLYTDGVPDAKSPTGERFGDRALLEALSGPLAGAPALLGAVTGGVERFRGGSGLPDDLTLVAVWTELRPADDPLPRGRGS